MTEGQKKPDSLAERQSKIGGDAESLRNRRSTSRTRLKLRQTGPTRRGSNRRKSGESPDSKKKIKTRKTEKDKKRTKPASRSLIVHPSPRRMERRLTRRKAAARQVRRGNPKREIRRKKAQQAIEAIAKGEESFPSRLTSQEKGDGSPEDSPSEQSENDSSPQQNRRRTPGRERDRRRPGGRCKKRKRNSNGYSQDEEHRETG